MSKCNGHCRCNKPRILGDGCCNRQTVKKPNSILRVMHLLKQKEIIEERKKKAEKFAEIIKIRRDRNIRIMMEDMLKNKRICRARVLTHTKNSITLEICYDKS